ncbi:hypothetical protein G6F65_022650 [Rhizopus arrhizus]|nr:hypothetical protein G6F65_022650 [Rhizopus arrhizus]
MGRAGLSAGRDHADCQRRQVGRSNWPAPSDAGGDWRVHRGLGVVRRHALAGWLDCRPRPAGLGRRHHDGVDDGLR